MKKILLIGNTKATSVVRLKEEAEKKGVVFDCLSSFELLRKKEISHDVLEYDVYYFRGLSQKTVGRVLKMAMELARKGKKIVEPLFGEGAYPEDKDIPESQSGLYTTPETKMMTKETFPGDITFPVVAKELGSSLGRGVKKINSYKELKDFAENTGGMFIVQEFFDITYDTRVLVVGDNVLGGFNRYKKEGEELLTTKPGGKRERAELSKRQIEAAREVTNRKGLMIAGIDMFCIDDEVYILEVNTSPQFRVFESITGVNVASEIIDFLLK